MDFLTPQPPFVIFLLESNNDIFATYTEPTKLSFILVIYSVFSWPQTLLFYIQLLNLNI